MARITRSRVLIWMQNVLGLQSGSDKIPQYIQDNVQPVVEITPKITDVVVAGSANVTTSTVIYSTPSDKDFYLTFLEISVTKDAVNDNLWTYAGVKLGGLERAFCSLQFQTTTAGSAALIHDFGHPVKVDRGTDIRVIGSFAAGNMVKRLTVGGFILE